MNHPQVVEIELLRKIQHWRCQKRQELTDLKHKLFPQYVTKYIPIRFVGSSIILFEAAIRSEFLVYAVLLFITHMLKK